MKKWACDFETTTDKDDCRIWLFGCYSLETEEFKWGTDIYHFINWSTSDSKHPKICYFHNLAFDSEFIIDALFRAGFVHRFGTKKLNEKEFTTLISETGVIYSMKIKLNGCYCTFYDSLKILKYSVKDLPKAFGLEYSKGEIDYKKYREIGYKPDENEINYLYYDVKIVAKALKLMFDKGIDKITLPSSAISFYKNLIGESRFKNDFPELTQSEDKYIRASYRGGFTYLNPKFKNKIIENGNVFDVNSLYPAMMHSKLLPYGKPKHFNGKYKYDKTYPLYVQGFICRFELKENHIPTIQIKHSMYFSGTEYLTTSNGEEVYLCLTNVDLQLFFNHYNVTVIEYLDGYKFMGSKYLFKEYVEYWSQIKIESKNNRDVGMYTIAKLMLNSFYGKFGTNPVGRNKIPVWMDDKVHYIKSDKITRNALYIPVATFVTSYARETTIRAAQNCYNDFIYADTDSLHLATKKLPNIDIHNTKLGSWKHESEFLVGKYLRSKCYMELLREPNSENDYKWKITVAGMPPSCYNKVNIDNFNYGSSYAGKLQTKRVKGGVVLIDTVFTIKE